MALGWNTAGSSTYVKVLHLGTYALCHAGAVHRFLGLMDVSVEGHPLPATLRKHRWDLSKQNEPAQASKGLHQFVF